MNEQMNDQTDNLTRNTTMREDNPFQIDFALSAIFSVTIAAWACLIIYSMIL